MKERPTMNEPFTFLCRIDPSPCPQNATRDEQREWIAHHLHELFAERVPLGFKGLVRLVVTVEPADSPVEVASR